MSESLTLTPTQEKVLALITAGQTITAAAQSVGVHRNTVGNWLRSSPDFQDALTLAHHQQAVFWREQAEQLATQAFDNIRSILNDPKAPAATRLRASLAVIKLASTPLGPFPFALDTSAAQPDQLTGTHKSAQRPSEDHDPSVPARPLPYVRTGPKTGRNDPCPCGSGRKFKQCCLLAPHSNPQNVT